MAQKFLVDIDMSGNNVSNLAAPSSSGDAATKSYVDNHLPTRQTVTVTTESLAQYAAEELTATMGLSYQLLTVETDKAARVQVYASADYRTADSEREIGTDPEGDHGVVADVVTTDAMLVVALSPQPHGSSLGSTPSTSIPIRVTNLDNDTGAVEVKLTFIRTE
jgi:hypothetical protein